MPTKTKPQVMTLHFKCLCGNSRFEIWRGPFISCVKCHRGFGVLNKQWTLWRCLRCKKETGCDPDCKPTPAMKKMNWEFPVYRYGVIKIGDPKSRAEVERQIESGIPKEIVFPDPDTPVNLKGPTLVKV